MDFHSHFSDDSAQNSAIKLEDMKFFIYCVCQNNFFIKDGIIYETTDRCFKQYKCTNEMWLLSVLVFTYRVIIDRCINYPINWRNKLYGINGSDK